eukprot:scaffold49379_cov52-Phaeocystis_antarctica.AAC.2
MQPSAGAPCGWSGGSCSSAGALLARTHGGAACEGSAVGALCSRTGAARRGEARRGGMAGCRAPRCWPSAFCGRPPCCVSRSLGRHQRPPFHTMFPPCHFAFPANIAFARPCSGGRQGARGWRRLQSAETHVAALRAKRALEWRCGSKVELGLVSNKAWGDPHPLGKEVICYHPSSLQQFQTKSSTSLASPVRT